MVLCGRIHLEVDPLVRRYGGRPWEPWPIGVAEERLLDEVQRRHRRLGLEG